MLHENLCHCGCPKEMECNDKTHQFDNKECKCVCKPPYNDKKPQCKLKQKKFWDEEKCE